MRFILFIICTAFAFLASCKSQKPATTEEVNTTSQTDTIVVMMEEKADEDTLLLSFERTACYGRCPIYKIKAYKSGFTTFEGLNFTEKLGFFASRIELSELERLYEEAESIGYFEMKDKYDKEGVTDLPSVISMIDMHGKKKRIVARLDVPQQLQDFHQEIDDTFDQLSWKNYNDR